jgi:4-amino-4-deoxy-L-arabinose transferase-like glycosyltransferase
VRQGEEHPAATTETPGAAAPSPAAGRSGAAAAAILLAALLVQGLMFIAESSQTSDEAAHLLAGYSYLKTGNFLTYPGEPPLMKEIGALPLLLLDLDLPQFPSEDMPRVFLLGPKFLHENRVQGDTILFLARLPMLGLSLLLGLAIYRWGLRLYGGRGALLALALYVFDPNIVAHSGVVMTDLGATLFFFLALDGLWRWSERPSSATLVLTGLALGGAFASKYTALWLVPILLALGAVLIVTRAPIPERPLSSRGWVQLPAENRVASLVLAATVLAIVAFLVVVLSYAGSGLGAYWVGLEHGLFHSQAGYTGYLMGRHSPSGWWYYYLFAYLVKTPLGSLAIVALAIAAALSGRRRLPPKDEAFLWIPVATILAITAVWKIHIGLRHVLPIYPFLCLAAGRVAGAAGAGRLLPRRGAGSGRGARLDRLLPAAALLCAAATAVEAVSIVPNDLAYFNPLVGGPRRGHLYLLDSNLDWGQASKALVRYVAAQRLPAIYCSFASNADPWYDGLRYQYVPGILNPEVSRSRDFLLPDGLGRELLAVSAMSLHLVRLGGGTLWDWLKNRPVVAMPGYAYLVYDLTGDAEAHAILAQLYLAEQLPALASVETRRALNLEPGNRRARAILQQLPGG